MKGNLQMLKWKKDFAGSYTSTDGRFTIEGNGGNGFDSSPVWRVWENGECHDCWNTLREAKEACNMDAA
jgi:hypothetical protein